MIYVSLDDLAGIASQIERGENRFSIQRELERGKEPDTQCAPLLPAGGHRLDLDELRELTAGRPPSAVRAWLFAELTNYADCLRGLGVARELWMYGSFLSDKAEPSDVDLLVVLRRHEFQRRLAGPEASQLVAPFDQHALLADRGLDTAYFFDDDLMMRACALGDCGFQPFGTKPRGFAIVPLLNPSDS